MNTALVLSYIGSHYHGWQQQKNGITVQETVSRAIERATGHYPSLSGAGRTDAGVHARRYVANFKTPHSIPFARLPLAVNAFLPEDIAVSGACAVPEEFDARFSCQKKEYTYLLYPALPCASGAPALRDPFLAGRATFYPYPLHIGAMKQAAACFVGKKDFAAVRNLGTPVKSTVREVFWCEVSADSRLCRIRVCADGFLYNMVRAIAGTLLYVGQGKIKPEEISAILESGDRLRAGPTLPPGGLYMTRLWYPDTPALAPFDLTGETAVL